MVVFFFFQAEDGIRDVAVTGVQTCALPIFIPAGEGRALRAFHNRRAYDGDGQIAAAARKNGFAKTFRERVSIRPAQMLRPAQADTREPIPGPACAIAFQNAVELSGGRCRFVAAASKRLAPT